MTRSRSWRGFSRSTDRLLSSDSPKGPVTFAFPLDALNLLLPNLYPEASALDIDS